MMTTKYLLVMKNSGGNWDSDGYGEPCEESTMEGVLGSIDALRELPEYQDAEFAVEEYEDSEFVARHVGIA